MEIENKVSRESFKVSLPSNKDRDMAVFTHAKKLSEYIYIITEKSPKKYRWNMVSRLQNCSTMIIEELYNANYERNEMRIEFQKRAMVQMNLLDFYAETAKKMQAINGHQMSVIAQQIEECKRLLAGWVKSTKEKLKK